MREPKKLYRPAESLDEVHQTLSPQPLETKKEMAVFYKEQLNKFRDENKVERIQQGLVDAFGGNYYKALLIGHQGVGKSTELNRLIVKMVDQFRAIKFSVTNDLHPGCFKPFDILLYIIAEVAEKTKEITGYVPSNNLLQEIWDWFASEEVTRTEAQETAIRITGGAGTDAIPLLAKIMGLFLNIKGEIKCAANRKKEIVEYRLQRLSTLINLSNKLLDECNQSLMKFENKEWLFIGDDFEKPEIPIDVIHTFFLVHAHVLQDIHAHLVFTIPIALAYSQQSSSLRFPIDRKHSIPDIPVFKKEHILYKEGREAIRAVLESRIRPDLFDRGQLFRLIVASGGNLQDLFSLVSEASDLARMRNAIKIGKKDLDRAISKLRTEYVNRLGESPYDPEKVPYGEKAKYLVQIYFGKPITKIPNAFSYSLLRARAVQEFNGERWFGVHPLVVDILQEQGYLQPDGSGRVPGGTV